MKYIILKLIVLLRYYWDILFYGCYMLYKYCIVWIRVQSQKEKNNKKNLKFMISDKIF